MGSALSTVRVWKLQGHPHSTVNDAFAEWREIAVVEP